MAWPVYLTMHKNKSSQQLLYPKTLNTAQGKKKTHIQLEQNKSFVQAVSSFQGRENPKIPEGTEGESRRTSMGEAVRKICS